MIDLFRLCPQCLKQITYINKYVMAVAQDKQSVCFSCANINRYTLPNKLSKKYKINQVTHCWEWIGMKDKDGYGKIKILGRQKRAHRVSFEYYISKIPDGLVLDHLCKNRCCVNPTHLEIVTSKENLLRGDTFQGKNFRKTHCKRGHEFSESNTGINKKNNRYCKMCEKLKQRAYKANLPWRIND